MDSLAAAKDDISRENSHNVKLAKTAPTQSISDAKKARAKQTEPAPPGVETVDTFNQDTTPSGLEFPQFEDCFSSTAPPSHLPTFQPSSSAPLPPSAPLQPSAPVPPFQQYQPGYVPLNQLGNSQQGYFPYFQQPHQPPPGYGYVSNGENPHSQGFNNGYYSSFGFPWHTLQRPNQDQGHGLDDSTLKEKFPSLYNANYFDVPATQFLSLQFLAKEEMTEKNRFFNNPKTVEDKLVANEVKVLVETLYNECVDDLQHKLHPVRFARFPVIPSTDLFKQIADVIDPVLIPISSYDLTHTINSHQVS